MKISLVLLSGVILLAAMPAAAQSSPTTTPGSNPAAPAPGRSIDEARAHLRAAEAFYDEGRYEEAAREMEAAYRIRAAPDLQYNLAQCYERLGRPADAKRAYEKYLEGNPTADDREVVRTRIANLEERMRAGNVDVVTGERVVLKTVVVYREAPPPPGRGARFAAYGLGGLALASLGSGIAFAVLAGRNADQVSAGGNLDQPVVWGGHVADADSAGRTQSVAAGVSFGVAVVAAAGAAGLYYFGYKIDQEAARESARTSLAPLLLPGGGGLAAMGRF